MTSDVFSRFKHLYLTFDIDAIEAETEHLLQVGVLSKDLLSECQTYMKIIGDKFESGEYFLAELVVAGELFKRTSMIMKAKSDYQNTERIGAIVLGTPKGDIHNLGKDIFAILAEASGFEVHDLGVDVPPEKFIRKIEETGAPIVGFSCLLTTTFNAIEDVVKMLEGNGMRKNVKIIIGGGSTTRDLIDILRVDEQTWDAFEGVRIAKRFMGIQV